MNLIDLAETGFVPDALIRIGIRRLLAKRLHAASAAELREFAEQLRNSPLAIATDAANQQHYEVPAAFFEKVLGPRLKYSSCFFATPASSLSEAEDEMLRRTCERAEIEDGMRVLELGCGWGSLTLWIAEHFSSCQVTAVSNSASQREFIETRARARELTNVRVITADMRNFDLLFRLVSNWLTPEGKAFVHVFCHRDTPYLFETDGAENWMGRHFFTGGMMPSEDLFSHFSEDLAIQRQWRVSGLHYWRTCEAWLKKLDGNRAAILECFRENLPDREAKLSLQRWRIFFMACAELFRYRGGDEWFVGHYLFQQARTKSLREQSPRRNEQEPVSQAAQISP